MPNVYSIREAKWCPNFAWLVWNCLALTTAVKACTVFTPKPQTLANVGVILLQFCSCDPLLQHDPDVLQFWKCDPNNWQFFEAKLTPRNSANITLIFYNCAAMIPIPYHSKKYLRENLYAMRCIISTSYKQKAGVFFRYSQQIISCSSTKALNKLNHFATERNEKPLCICWVKFWSVLRKLASTQRVVVNVFVQVRAGCSSRILHRKTTLTIHHWPPISTLEKVRWVNVW